MENVGIHWMRTEGCDLLNVDLFQFRCGPLFPGLNHRFNFVFHPRSPWGKVAYFFDLKASSAVRSS
jgi:hypothetical protein